MNMAGHLNLEITFTLDVEDYTDSGSAPRALAATRDILDYLGERNVRGTFFIVGELADALPQLVTDIAAGGHEVGLHGHRHAPLTETDPETFRREVTDARTRLEGRAGGPVIGFRAPTFSLVPATVWAADVLAEIGFEYSSSVLPARSPLYGWPGQPRTPYRWPSGLLELPCPVAEIGPVTNPYLGGVFLRVLPWSAVRYGLRHAGPSEVLWTYSHPYDFDPGEPFQPRPDLGRGKSRLQWLNRKRMFDRFDRLYAGNPPGLPLAERLSTITV